MLVFCRVNWWMFGDAINLAIPQWVLCWLGETFTPFFALSYNDSEGKDKTEEGWDFASKRLEQNQCTEIQIHAALRRETITCCLSISLLLQRRRQIENMTGTRGHCMIERLLKDPGILTECTPALQIWWSQVILSYIGLYRFASHNSSWIYQNLLRVYSIFQTSELGLGGRRARIEHDGSVRARSEESNWQDAKHRSSRSAVLCCFVESCDNNVLNCCCLILCFSKCCGNSGAILCSKSLKREFKVHESWDVPLVLYC